MGAELELLLADLYAAGFHKGMTAEQAARATFAAVRKAAERDGQDPDIECFIAAPEDARRLRNDACWLVCWEAGPHDWAVAVSLAGVFPNVVEPYYGFDLTFFPGEWSR